MISIYIIIHTHDCNKKVITNLFSIFCLLNDKIKNNNLSSLFSFSKLREIFFIFNNKGYDTINELIIHLIRNLVNKQQEKIKFLDATYKNKYEANNNISNYKYNDNKDDTEFLFFLSEDQILEILLIFINSIQLMRNKILNIQDMKKNNRIMINIINNIFIICTIIICIIENDSNKIQFINNFRIIDYIIDIIITIKDKGYYNDIEENQKSLDLASFVSNKILILKKIFFVNKVLLAIIQNNTQITVNIINIIIITF